jgi:hypothetical protein
MNDSSFRGSGFSHITLIMASYMLTLRGFWAHMLLLYAKTYTLNSMPRHIL